MIDRSITAAKISASNLFTPDICAATTIDTSSLQKLQLNLDTAAIGSTYVDYADRWKIQFTVEDEDENKRVKKMIEEKKEKKEKKEKNYADIFKVKRITPSGPVTVVLWEDGTKTIVRRSENAVDDPYNAFCAALAKKVFGNNTRVKKILSEKTVMPKERKKKNVGDSENQES